ncbi:MAG: formate/nitrite transporter family protein [[Eubacterium] sulci]|mgnify:FL=1|nr:formate/nitrite transporter family protein [[Eubacterium] sulci]
MIERNFLTPSEVAGELVTVAENKANLSLLQKIVLGIIAGAYIAFAAVASNTAAFQLMNNPSTLGLSKLLSAFVFSGGLILVVVCGSELFTGNNLMLMGVYEKKISVKQLLISWGIVYVANFVGSILIAFMVAKSGQLGFAGSMLGGATIKIACTKVSLSTSNAILLGIMCNWLVCLAVWGSTAARDIGSKIMAIFFPIMMFVTAGFEHSIVNMYYISAGLFAKENSQYVDAALQLGLKQSDIANLDWSSFFLGNLFPVTLGNIIGGTIFVGTAYWLAFMRKK